MVFVTVGSQKFPFDRLLKAVDECVGDGSLPRDTFAQSGTSSYVPAHCKSRDFLNRDEFAAKLDACEVLVTHGGTGSIVRALKRGKRVIAMPRLARYGEHVDDHQVQLLEEFEGAGLLLTCHDARSLAEAYAKSLTSVAPCYETNNARFVEDLDRYLSGRSPR